MVVMALLLISLHDDITISQNSRRNMYSNNFKEGIIVLKVILSVLKQNYPVYHLHISAHFSFVYFEV